MPTQTTGKDFTGKEFGGYENTALGGAYEKVGIVSHDCLVVV
jgi:hypothetical protein